MSTITQPTPTSTPASTPASAPASAPAGAVAAAIHVKPGVTETLTYSIQQQGTAAGRECRTILLGQATGRFYCADAECTYSAPKWSSVFAHRSSHAKAASLAAAQQEEAINVQMARTMTENVVLRTRLDAETERRRRAERQLRRLKKATA